jgi:serine/threonine protein kinase
MYKLVNEKSPVLIDNQCNWDQSFIDFISSCLVKDPKLRPNAEQILEINKKFFAKAKDKTFLAQTLLKGVPTIQERVRKLFLIYII